MEVEEKIIVIEKPIRKNGLFFCPTENRDMGCFNFAAGAGYLISGQELFHYLITVTLPFRLRVTFCMLTNVH